MCDKKGMINRKCDARACQGRKREENKHEKGNNITCYYLISKKANQKKQKYHMNNMKSFKIMMGKHLQTHKMKRSILPYEELASG